MELNFYINVRENRSDNQEWTNQREKTDREIKNGRFRERGNRRGNQELTIQREKTEGAFKNGQFRERKPMGKSRMDNSETLT